MSLPIVSIVTATYNSTHYLNYAIRSVLQSDFDDWELIVIGDHCTDDTEDLVVSFNDPRISFVNLPENSGQQAKPNNVGVERARGEYLCFLNHDDMFMPDHFSAMLNEMAHKKADIVCARYAVIEPFDLADPPDRIPARNGGADPVNPRYDPVRFYVASCWFMRRKTALEVGPWRTEDETYVTPSQDWLFRAARSGNRIHCSTRISVIALYSGQRRDAYRRKLGDEHAYVFSRMQDPHFVDSIEASIIESEARANNSLLGRLRSLYRFLVRPLSHIGIHPNTPQYLLRYGGKGGYVRKLKQKTG